VAGGQSRRRQRVTAHRTRADIDGGQQNLPPASLASAEPSPAVGRHRRSYSSAPTQPGLAGRYLAAGLTAALVSIAGALLQDNGAQLVAVMAVGCLFVVVLALAVDRFPWLIPWAAVAIFATSAEARLRLAPELGVVKDLFVLMMIAVCVLQVFRRPALLDRLRPVGASLLSFGIVIGLYLLNPAGPHGTSWLVGTRLLLEVVALLLLGMLCLEPRRTLAHLVRAVSVLLPLEAAFAWVQQWAGSDALVYQWGYQYGAQIRLTSNGGLRTSGTFEDPFQLAGFAVLGLALALFVASGRQAIVLALAAIAALGATSVRTALVQAGILLLIFAIRRGWARQAMVIAAAAIVAGVFLLATTTAAVRPGAAAEPLLLTLNGRSTAWAQAIQGWESLVIGNGVGERGSGSLARNTAISAPPAYNPTSEPAAEFAGSPAFLDSSYAQVQSDVGIVGSIGLVAGIVGFGLVLVRRCRQLANDRAAWAALAVLIVSAVDWIGRSSLASYSTGFLTMYIIGVLVAVPNEADREP
jgi:hypothetical protein